MNASFDPYHIWLGIPPEDQPPSHYRLLGIPELESNPDVIDAGAEQRTVFLRTFQTGDQAQLAEQLLNEVSAARVCLLDAEQKAEYDQQLQGEMQPAPTPPPVVPPPSRPTQPTQPIWQQPRILAVAGGAVAVILLLVVLNTGGDKPSPIENGKEPATAKADKQQKVPPNEIQEEGEAELKRQVDDHGIQELSKTEEAAETVQTSNETNKNKEQEEWLLARKAAAAKAAVDREAERLVAERLAVETSATETVITLSGHTGSINGVAFSPDGKQIVSGSSDKTVKVWDTETGQPLLALIGHSSYVRGVAFSPDGKRIVSGSGDRTVRVWDVETGQELLTLKGHSSDILIVAYSPDGKRIASGGMDHTVKVWNLADANQGTGQVLDKALP